MKATQSAFYDIKMSAVFVQKDRPDKITAANTARNEKKNHCCLKTFGDWKSYTKITHLYLTVYTEVRTLPVILLKVSPRSDFAVSLHDLANNVLMKHAHKDIFWK